MTSVEQYKVTVAPTRLTIDRFVFTIDFFELNSKPRLFPQKLPSEHHAVLC